MLPVILICVLLKCVNSDISHFLKDTLYGIGSTTTERPFIPEIIINRHGNPGRPYQTYNYEKPEIVYIPPLELPPNYYVPPPVEAQPPQPPQSPQFPIPHPLPPLNDETPSQGYLPPPPQDNNDGFINFDYPENQNGYDYNHPTTTTAQPSFPSIPESDIPGLLPQNPDTGYNYNNPSQTPPSVYLPSVIDRAPKDFGLFSVREKNPIRLNIKEMRCLPNQGGFFKSILKIDSLLSTIPIVDNDIIDNRCDLRLIRSELIVNIQSEDFQRCGVINCGHNLCLRLRFPQLPGMKTGIDSILTLQCKVQERVVAKTHALKIGVSQKSHGRSIGAIAQGGTQQPFRTQMELFKKSSNGYTKLLEPHGLVQLGDEMLLRAHVQSGDGWNYTKLSDIYLQRVSPSNEIVNTAVLIGSNGCVNPTMRTICPVPPIFDPPLGHRLSFKAVMFQGMKSGDEILMTMKISGCMDQRDCHINYGDCERRVGTGGQRSRRDVKTNNMTEYSEVSSISFRVEIPKVEDLNELNSLKSDGREILIIGGTLFGICFMSIIAVLTYFKLK